MFSVRKVEDTKRIIRNNTDKDIQYNGQNNKGQRDKQWSIKHTHKTKDQVTRTH
jgi:hypothetical protein